MRGPSLGRSLHRISSAPSTPEAQQGQPQHLPTMVFRVRTGCLFQGYLPSKETGLFPESLPSALSPSKRFPREPQNGLLPEVR